MPRSAYTTRPAGGASFCDGERPGRGIGQKMLDFARKKLPEHEHPVLTVLNANTRALALYRRMGWQVVGAKEKFDPAKDPLVVRPSQVLEMRYQAENRSNRPGNCRRSKKC